MANGAIGNAFYIDSSGLNVDIDMDVMSAMLICTNTTSLIQLTLKTNTAQIIYQQTSPDNNPVSISTYLGGVSLGKLFVKTLTAATGIFYYR